MSAPERPPVVAILNDDDTGREDDSDFWKEAIFHLSLFHHYKVEFFTDYKEFLGFVLNPGQDVDAAVIDFHLKFLKPGSKDEFETFLATSLLDQIRASPSRSDSFTVIVMTGYFTYDSRITSFEHLASDVIAKFEFDPFSKQTKSRGTGFAKALHAMLQRQGVGSARKKAGISTSMTGGCTTEAKADFWINRMLSCRWAGAEPQPSRSFCPIPGRC